MDLSMMKHQLLAEKKNIVLTFALMAMRDAQDVEIPPLPGRSNKSLGRRAVTPELK